ncbi:putative MutL-like DNA mismatch repair protein [Hamiltosporidium tvaerminnensis]|uniref:Putative MutL-like DNA mismatch repair protein n=1 Tax=Hamiltosporidium tvaerminnensis TaxID=1176355 RepID=A0A4Q9KYW8_9MICR|nr:putative MutL-like DNA mismatch repair protein [Hamiltosporidium tvaerminnensis]
MEHFLTFFKTLKSGGGNFLKMNLYKSTIHIDNTISLLNDNKKISNSIIFLQQPIIYEKFISSTTKTTKHKELIYFTTINDIPKPELSTYKIQKNKSNWNFDNSNIHSSTEYGLTLIYNMKPIFLQKFIFELKLNEIYFENGILFIKIDKIIEKIQNNIFKDNASCFPNFITSEITVEFQVLLDENRNKLNIKYKNQNSKKPYMFHNSNTVNISKYEISKESLIGQFNNEFIIIKNHKSLFILDQHAIHERIRLEKFIKNRNIKESITETELEILKSKACRGAIKFGDNLNDKELTKILEEIKYCDHPFICAHGRPSIRYLNEN